VFTQLVLDLLPVFLRLYFKKRWQETYHSPWRDTSQDGKTFWFGRFEDTPCCYVQVTAGSRQATCFSCMAAGDRFQAGDPLTVGERVAKVAMGVNLFRWDGPVKLMISLSSMWWPRSSWSGRTTRST
jgi:hypothetical protein